LGGGGKNEKRGAQKGTEKTPGGGKEGKTQVLRGRVQKEKRSCSELRKKKKTPTKGRRKR